MTAQNKYETIVFDMDGVLVDVTASYRETIVRTVEHFTGQTVTAARIQEYKNSGGWNNDWLLSRRLAADFGVDVPYAEIVDYFNRVFLDEGLIHRERWIASPGLLERLGENHRLAIFTGRSRLEASITLNREGWQDKFFIVTSDDVANEKPAPDGLHRIREVFGDGPMLYIGDTVDDARAGRAAQVPFAGIASPLSPWRDELARCLASEGAIAVLDDINQLETLL